MTHSRLPALVGALGSLLIHAVLFAVFANAPTVSFPASDAAPITSDWKPNAVGRGFQGSLIKGPRARVPGDGAPEFGHSDTEVVAQPSDRTSSAALSSSPAVQGIAERLRPVVDYRDWSPVRVIRHLVESTLVVLVVFLLTTLLRRSHASSRYALWLAASMKFFVPFSALIGVGAAIGGVVPRVDLGRPFTSRAVDSVWSSVSLTATAGAPSLTTAADMGPWLVSFAAVVWIIGSVTMVAIRCRLWRRVQAAWRASVPLTISGVEVPPGLQLRSAPGWLEPGVIGWRRPVLLLPNGIVERLQRAELHAVVAHEACHVRRRDNLTATLHMLTEVVFWFHPAVWLIGSRLLAERERACDEAVLAEGHAPATYARAIVQTCAICVTSPVACVAGMTGSPLGTRIEAILRNVSPDPPRGWRRVSLALTIVVIVAGPIGYGVGRAAPPIQQSATAAPVAIPADPTVGDAVMFEAASVRLNTSGLDSGTDRMLAGGRYTATNLPLGVFIRLAYTPASRTRSLEPFEVTGGPDWLLSDRFDINATAGHEASVAELRTMLRTLLADRFHVKTHVEQRLAPAFRMSLRRPGRLGSGIRRSEADCPSTVVGTDQTVNARGQCGFFGPAPSAPVNAVRAYQALRGLTMDEFAVLLSAHLGRHVINNTGLTGSFDGDLEFTAEIMLPPPPTGPNPFDGRTLPSIFSVLPQELALQLEATRAPVDVLVIDTATRPVNDDFETPERNAAPGGR